MGKAATAHATPFRLRTASDTPAGFAPVNLSVGCGGGQGLAWDGRPPLSRHRLLVVLVRCHEGPRCILQQLFQQSVPFLVYQKQAGRCGGAVPLPAGAEPAIRTLPHNLGRECAGYLRYIVDHYDDLPRMTAFLQMGSLMHMPFQAHIWQNIGFLRGNATHTPQFAGLSKNSIEGEWPAPCEDREKVSSICPSPLLSCHSSCPVHPEQRAAMNQCAADYWRDASGENGPEAGRPPPKFFRFFANGLFAASRKRIRARPRSLYASMLARLEGSAPLRCTHPATTRHAKAAAGWGAKGLHGSFADWANSSRVAPAETDCLMLEKLWHVLLGEPAEMPPPAEYNARVRGHASKARSAQIKCPVVPPE